MFLPLPTGFDEMWSYNAQEQSQRMYIPQNVYKSVCSQCNKNQGSCLQSTVILHSYTYYKFLNS